MPYQYGMQNNIGLPPRAVQRAVGVSPDFPVVGGGLGGLPVRGPSAPTRGQQAYTTAGTFSWIAPAGVTSVSVVAVGGGGGSQGGSVGGSGGGGGELRYKNAISVTPGLSYTVVVGAGGVGDTITTRPGAQSSFINSATVAANGGGGGGAGNNPGAGGSGGVGDGGGNGGRGGANAQSTINGAGAGGGAGGYSGTGGGGGNITISFGTRENGTAGSGGGGGGGGTGGPYLQTCCGAISAAGGRGGGVGLGGEGVNGAGGLTTSTINAPGQVGGTGSPFGTAVGGGAPCGGQQPSPTLNVPATGTSGGVRIIWPGNTRSFPSTNTGDL